MKRLAILMIFGLSSSAGAAMVRSIGLRGSGYLINGGLAAYAGSGDFKEVLLLPADPGLVVKVFYAKAESSVPVMLQETAALKVLAPLNVAPKLIEAGARVVRGVEAGYLVQERVRGSTLERVSAVKLERVRALFKKLSDAGLELTDVNADFKLRENIMVGKTRSGPVQAYLVDPSFKISDRTEVGLRAFYGGLLERLAAPNRR